MGNKLHNINCDIFIKNKKKEKNRTCNAWELHGNKAQFFERSLILSNYMNNIMNRIILQHIRRSEQAKTFRG